LMFFVKVLETSNKIKSKIGKKGKIKWKSKLWVSQ
jgi:hypothetical protein